MMITCNGCEFLRHELPEGSVPGLRHLFRCMNPAHGIFCGHTVEAVPQKFYYDERPIRPVQGFCKKEGIM